MIAAVCLAAAVSAEPEPFYGYAGYGLAPGYLHQQTWPSAAGPLGSSTCYGCRRPDTVVAAHHYLGKRSAEPEPYYGYYGHPYAYGAYGAYGHAYGLAPHAYGLALPALKALPAPAVATAAGPTGVAGHPGVATSFVARSPQGLRGKRSAEPYYGYAGYYGHPYGAYGAYRGGFYGGYGAGVAGHPTGTSFVARSPQGLGK